MVEVLSMYANRGIGEWPCWERMILLGNCVI
jgi:hypothetical protein